MCVRAKFALYPLQGKVCVLLVLMSVLSQSFFTLVSRHLMSFLLFSVWHSFVFFSVVIMLCVSLLLYGCYSCAESLGRLEGRNVVFGHNETNVL